MSCLGWPVSGTTTGRRQRCLPRQRATGGHPETVSTHLLSPMVFLGVVVKETSGQRLRGPRAADPTGVLQRVSEPAPDISVRMAARPASSRATGTRGGEQDT